VVELAVAQVPGLPNPQAAIAARAPVATEVLAPKAVPEVEANAAVIDAKAAVPTSAAVDDLSTDPSTSSWKS
jgi:hypothetical protein